MTDLSKLSNNMIIKFTKVAEEELNAPNRIEQRNPAIYDIEKFAKTKTEKTHLFHTEV